MLYKKIIGDPSYTVINIQSTLVGIINLFFLWPVLIILHYTGAELFVIPTGFTQDIVVATSILVFVNNYLFTFGKLLVLPATVIVDWLVFGAKMDVFKIVGTVTVALGFLLVNVEVDWGKLKEKICK